MVDRAAGLEQIDDAVVVGDVGDDAVGADFVGGGFHLVGAARGDDHVGALRLGQFGGRQTDAGRASDDNDLLTCKQHDVSSDEF